jgi:hypothetical protein
MVESNKWQLFGGAAVTYTQFFRSNMLMHLSWRRQGGVTSDQTYLVLNQNVCSHYWNSAYVFGED